MEHQEPDAAGSAFMAAYDAFEVRVARTAGVLNAVHAELVDLVAEALDQGFAEGYGTHSPGHWLAWQAGLSPAHAAGIVRLARRRDELHTVMAALRAGELALDAALEIARLAPADHEQSVTELAKVATVSQLRRVLRDYGYDHDSQEEPGTNRPQVEERSVAMGTDEKGWWLRGRLSPDEGAVVERAIVAAREDRYRVLLEEQRALEGRLGLPVGEPPSVTAADGLLAMAEASLAAGARAHPGSDRYLVHLHLDASPSSDDPRGVLSIGLGMPLPAALRSLLLCDAELRPVFEVHGTALSVGRRTRAVSGRLRRVIEHRDKGCRVPGCGRTYGLEVHHLRHWEDAGPTDTDNLVCLCRAHHRQHHLGLIGMAGDADLPPGAHGAVRFTDRFGRDMAPARTSLPPDLGAGAVGAAEAIGIAPEPDAYVHPYGGRLESGWVTLYPSPAASAAPVAQLSSA